MRYLRQVHEVNVPLVGSGPVEPGSLDAAIALFETLYKQKYGPESTYREAGIELVRCRVRGIGIVEKPVFRAAARNGGRPEEALVETRNAYFPGAGTILAVPGYELERLSPGVEIAGPCLIWSVTTVVVEPGQRAQVDPYKSLVIRRGAS
jgi:N-methylhydantoinase A/oxoprolinase/acetone carboxylase beta subunit